ncbi:hypothetical protein [Sphingomonas faeni]|uniref:hypothetical protein n=1 Tax=Sphingomonas faeni TaxID=185950 RepID=UPI003345A795
MTVDPIFDHMAKAQGQTVHCDRAAFFATGGIPTQVVDRMSLGFHIGFGLVGGGTCAAGVIALVSKALKALFA